MVLLELLEDQHRHHVTSMRKIKKIDFGVLSGPRVGLASVKVHHKADRNEFLSAYSGTM